jgi:hypothetical protein
MKQTVFLVTHGIYRIIVDCNIHVSEQKRRELVKKYKSKFGTKITGETYEGSLYICRCEKKNVFISNSLYKFKVENGVWVEQGRLKEKNMDNYKPGKCNGEIFGKTISF